MLKTACTCNPSVVFERQSDWLKHYETGKPSDARARREYVKLHNIISVVTEHYVSPNGGGQRVQQVNTNDGLARLRQIQKELDIALSDQIRLEEERARLLRQLDPIPQVVPAEWTRSDIKGSCVKCGAKTFDRFRRAYQCRPACREERRSSNIVEKGSGLEQALLVILNG